MPWGTINPAADYRRHFEEVEPLAIRTFVGLKQLLFFIESHLHPIPLWLRPVRRLRGRIRPPSAPSPSLLFARLHHELMPEMWDSQL